jgi:transitional endoplasmic reticulum ATPase
MNILPRIKPSISLTMKEEYERIKTRYERKAHDTCRIEKGTVVTLDSIAGLADVKKELQESIILPLTKRKLVEKFKLRTGRAILLHSPPGCGKKYLLKAISNQYSIPLSEVSGSELLNAINAEGTLAIKGLWSSLRDVAPAILFITDIDSIASTESLEEEEGKKALSVFLSMLDGIRPNDMVVIIASTENPHLLDQSLFRRGRFDKKIFVPPPDLEMRKTIFELNLKEVPKYGDLDYDALASATEGYSSGDVYAIIEEAKSLALSRDEIFSDAPVKKKIPLGVKMDHLLAAVKKVKPSVSEWEERIKKSQETPQIQEPEAPEPIPPVPVSKPQIVMLPPPPPPPELTLTDEDIAMMTISQLEDQCKQLGLKPFGKKAVLKERLHEYLDKQEILGQGS